MKRIGLILTAMLAIAFLVPALSVAQSSQTVTVKGQVFNGAIPLDGATVQIYSWDGKSMGSTPYQTTTTSTVNGVSGYFEFKNVPYNRNNPLEYAIAAQYYGQGAHALVYIVAPQAASESPVVQPIYLDIKMWDWKTDLIGMVQTGNMADKGIGIANANISIYSMDNNGTVGQTPVTTTKTGSDGKFEVKNVLDYGQYQAVVSATANGNNYQQKVNFTVYQQQTNLLATMTNIIVATPKPTATASPSGSSSSSGFFGIPGFEAILALVAIGGAALFMRKKL